MILGSDGSEREHEGSRHCDKVHVVPFESSLVGSLDGKY